MTKALSTLSQKIETVAEKCDCRRKRETTAKFGDSLTFLRQYVTRCLFYNGARNSEPAKVVRLTAGALIDAYLEKPRQWNTNGGLVV